MESLRAEPIGQVEGCFRMSLHTRKRVPPPFAFAHTHTQDKLALGKLCSREAAYFKLPGNKIVPATATAPIHHRSR